MVSTGTGIVFRNGQIFQFRSQNSTAAALLSYLWWSREAKAYRFVLRLMDDMTMAMATIVLLIESSSVASLLSKFAPEIKFRARDFDFGRKFRARDFSFSCRWKCVETQQTRRYWVLFVTKDKKKSTPINKKIFVGGLRSKLNTRLGDFLPHDRPDAPTF